MRILLISSPVKVMGYLKWHTQNLGLLSIASNLDKKHQVKILEPYFVEKHFFKTIMDEIQSYKPDLIGLSAMTFQYKNIRLIALYIKKKYPDIITVLGGYHATLMYKEIYDSEDKNIFNFIVRNEGEITFNKLVNSLSNKNDNYKKINNLSYCDGLNVYHNETGELLDLSKLKSPDRDLIDHTKYFCYNLLTGNKESIAFVETSRGCTLSCNFCSINKMYGKSFRTYDLDRVINDIKKIKEKKIGVIFLIDDNILLDHERFEKLCDLIIENKLNTIKYVVQCSSTGLSKSEEIAKKMEKAGFLLIFLGIENNTEKNLKHLQKGNIGQHTKLAVKYLHKYNIPIFGGLITGLPEDTKRSISQIYKYAAKLKLEILGVQNVTPYPKTGIREIYLKNNLITNTNNYEFYDGILANIKTNYLTNFELNYYNIIESTKYYSLHFNLNKFILRNKPLLFFRHLIINPFLYLYYYIIKYKLNIKAKEKIKKKLDYSTKYYNYFLNIEDFEKHINNT